jgi:hypothetical protein
MHWTHACSQLESGISTNNNSSQLTKKKEKRLCRAIGGVEWTLSWTLFGPRKQIPRTAAAPATALTRELGCTSFLEGLEHSRKAYKDCHYWKGNHHLRYTLGLTMPSYDVIC